MATGTLQSPMVAGSPLHRLAIGVTSLKGELAELVYKPNPENPLELILVSEPPTEQELNEQYLLASGWGKDPLAGWRDPITDVIFHTDSALDIQSYRDTQNRVPDSAAMFANGEVWGRDKNLATAQAKARTAYKSNHK